MRRQPSKLSQMGPIPITRSMLPSRHEVSRPARDRDVVGAPRRRVRLGAALLVQRLSLRLGVRVPEVLVLAVGGSGSGRFDHAAGRNGDFLYGTTATTRRRNSFLMRA